MKKLFSERFLIGMAIGIIFGLSWGIESSVVPIQYAIVGGLVGGGLGLLFTKKTLTWIIEVLGKIGVP